ncbi:MAG: hypothetical protein D3914_12785 [Candidatus Electrothrix sp. LOE2]|nr:hypothetical protein [Candidatus Electrothrix sp. LOE2]
MEDFRKFLLAGVLLLLAIVSSVTFPTGAPIKEGFGFESLLGTLGGILIMVLLVERVTEIVLAFRRQAKKENMPQQDETKRIALIIGFSLGVLVCSAGVGMLSTILNTEGANQGLIRFVDIILTAGLIAGGSDGFHQFVAAIETFFVESRKNMKKDSGGGQE